MPIQCIGITIPNKDIGITIHTQRYNDVYPSLERNMYIVILISLSAVRRYVFIVIPIHYYRYADALLKVYRYITIGMPMTDTSLYRCMKDRYTDAYVS
jgi:hypothetical protein